MRNASLVWLLVAALLPPFGDGKSPKVKRTYLLPALIIDPKIERLLERDELHELRAVFKSIDRNRDKQLTRREILTYVVENSQTDIVQNDPLLWVECEKMVAPTPAPPAPMAGHCTFMQFVEAWGVTTVLGRRRTTPRGRPINEWRKRAAKKMIKAAPSKQEQALAAAQAQAQAQAQKAAAAAVVAAQAAMTAQDMDGDADSDLVAIASTPFGAAGAGLTGAATGDTVASTGSSDSGRVADAVVVAAQPSAAVLKARREARARWQQRDSSLRRLYEELHARASKAQRRGLAELGANGQAWELERARMRESVGREEYELAHTHKHRAAVIQHQRSSLAWRMRVTARVVGAGRVRAARRLRELQEEIRQGEADFAREDEGARRVAREIAETERLLQLEYEEEELVKRKAEEQARREAEQQAERGAKAAAWREAQEALRRKAAQEAEREAKEEEKREIVRANRAAEATTKFEQAAEAKREADSKAIARENDRVKRVAAHEANQKAERKAAAALAQKARHKVRELAKHHAAERARRMMGEHLRESEATREHSIVASTAVGQSRERETASRSHRATFEVLFRRVCMKDPVATTKVPMVQSQPGQTPSLQLPHHRWLRQTHLSMENSDGAQASVQTSNATHTSYTTQHSVVHELALRQSPANATDPVVVAAPQRTCSKGELLTRWFRGHVIESSMRKIRLRRHIELKRAEAARRAEAVWRATQARAQRGIEKRTKREAERKNVMRKSIARKWVQRQVERTRALRLQFEANRKVKRKIAEKAQRQAQEKAKHEAEEKARREGEEKAKRDAEEKAKREAEEKAKREAEEKAKREAEEKAKREAEETFKREAEEKVRREAEEKAKCEVEEKAKREAEEKAKREAEEKARREVEENAQREAEEQATLEADEKGKLEAEEQLLEADEHKHHDFAIQQLEQKFDMLVAEAETDVEPEMWKEFDAADTAAASEPEDERETLDSVEPSDAGQHAEPGQAIDDVYSEAGRGEAEAARMLEEEAETAQREADVAKELARKQRELDRLVKQHELLQQMLDLHRDLKDSDSDFPSPEDAHDDDTGRFDTTIPVVERQSGRTRARDALVSAGASNAVVDVLADESAPQPEAEFGPESVDECFSKCDTLDIPSAGVKYCADTVVAQAHERIVSTPQSQRLREQMVCEQGYSVGYSLGCTHYCLEGATLPPHDSSIQDAARDAVCPARDGAGANVGASRACHGGFASGVLAYLHQRDGFDAAVDATAAATWMAVMLK